MLDVPSTSLYLHAGFIHRSATNAMPQHLHGVLATLHPGYQEPAVFLPATPSSGTPTPLPDLVVVADFFPATPISGTPAPLPDLVVSSSLLLCYSYLRYTCTPPWPSSIVADFFSATPISGIPAPLPDLVVVADFFSATPISDTPAPLPDLVV